MSVARAVLVACLGCTVLACSSPPLAPGPPSSGPSDPAPPRSGAVLVASGDHGGDLERSKAFFETRAQMESPLTFAVDAPEGIPDLSAETCGACHREIYAEWAVSTHAAAWTDPQFQKEIGKSDNTWLCLNCHTPLPAQKEFWPVGLVDDDVERPELVVSPVFDKRLRDEGITCAGCHVVDNVVVGPGLADSVAPHPVRADPNFSTTAVCERCHQAVARYEGKSFECTFDTGSEWRDGPYPAEGTDCITCHMPRVDRPAAIGGPVRSVARHWWRGAGIPKKPGVYPPQEALPFGLEMEAVWGTSLEVTVANANAGHLLPTGDPERWIQIDVSFVDGEGASVGDAWTWRIGQTWEWWPAPKKLGDNRLAPRERRVFSVLVPQAAMRATVRASSHRMTAEAAAFHELEGYPLSVQTHEVVLARPK